VSTGKQWGVQLAGHPQDLAEWAGALNKLYEPYVNQKDNEFVLRWSGFDDLETAGEVYEKAASIVDQLNGAMAVHGIRAVQCGGVVEFRADGSRATTLFLAAANLEVRGAVVGVGVLIGPDEKERPSPPRPGLLQVEGMDRLGAAA
jgi:hypothetical protein